MRHLSLGRSNYQVPVVGQGTMGLGGYFERDESRDDAVISVLQAGIDAGMTLIDTAEIYGAGHAEELVGKAIQGRRAQVMVATKFAPAHSRYHEVIQAAEGSLKRLQIDTIDLYQSHWPQLKAPFDETLRALQQLLAEGKVACVGLSNATTKQIRLAQTAFSSSQFVALQHQYNLADRLVEENILPLCREKGYGLLAYSPLLEGQLAPHDERKSELARIADHLGIPLGQLVLAWLLRHPEVVVIPKAAHPHHLRVNLAASETKLPAEIMATIDQLYTQQLLWLQPREIEVADTAHRQAYKTIQEAIQNAAGMQPSPAELAEELRLGERFKPIKVRPSPQAAKPYQLMEGRLRYWAWIIAFASDKPIPCYPV